MTLGRQQDTDSQRRIEGRRIIGEQARRHVQTFLDELKNGTRNYRTVASLSGQVAQEYRGRAILELLQNAHDVLAFGPNDDPRRISFVLRSSPEPQLLVANSGRPFRLEDFRGLCQLAQSPKDPNESVGNKGLGFQSVLELSKCPQVWSTSPAGGSAAFSFGFHPDVCKPVARLVQQLLNGRLPTDPEFGTAHVVDWSEKQINQYRRQLYRDGVDPAEEVAKYLSPYVLPRFLDHPPCDVVKLLEDGHVTVICLPLDGGLTGSPEEAIRSVRDQIQELDEAAMVFLRHLSVLCIDMDGERVEFERDIDTASSLAAAATRSERLRVGRSVPDTIDTTRRSFRVWRRIVGGDGRPAEKERIAAAVGHLPNRWPEVRRVEVAVAVEETPEAQQGVFVIFLPTKMKTGVGAQVNAPFYSSLDRRQINFDDEYNELLLEFLTDLMIDAVVELVEDSPEPWRGRAVIDLLAPVAGSPTSDQAHPLAHRLRQRAFERARPLTQLPLILCDTGWHLPGVARTMPVIPDHDPIGPEDWRSQAGFIVASGALDQRREAVKALIGSLDGRPSPEDQEWACSLENMAEQIGRCRVTATWNDFLHSVLGILPTKLRSEPKWSDTDPLLEARFLPTEDNRLLAASDTVQIFFRPRRGDDDAADYVGSIPGSLRQRIAFLDPEVKTHEERQRRNTEVQKFLDGRFVRSFRREDLLRDVVLPSLPELPAAHGTSAGSSCAETLRWTLEMIGQEGQESLLRKLSRLPVACVGGWFPMREAVFGPGWEGRLGDQLGTLADCLPDEDRHRLLQNALLPPNDPCWTVNVSKRGDLFALAGVADGFRLQTYEPMRFSMSASSPGLPTECPVGIPRSEWNDWRDAFREQIAPKYHNWFQYELKGVRLLPLGDLFHRKDIADPPRRALADLILASLTRWDNGWGEVTITKVEGWNWSQRTTSPLKHWLSSLSWLDDGQPGGRQPLHQRWYVPESYLRGQRGRFRHLAPLSLELAQRLADDNELLRALQELGLNVFPTEDVLTGPDLLEALAEVAQHEKDMPAGGFDVFLGQVRHAWRHFDPDRGLPAHFLVRTRGRTLTVRTADELNDVYLPDHSARTRSLREHGQPILAMRPEEARAPVGVRLHESGARRAAGLEERCFIDGRSDVQATAGAQTLDEANLNWLPIVLLTLAAHGGINPRGPATDAWLEAARRLERTRVHRCDSIRVELQDAGQTVAHSAPRAHWLSQDNVLLLCRDVARSGKYEEVAAAFQAMLQRQDLLKDLRLVLGSLTGSPRPTPSQINDALDRAEIDAEAVNDIRLRWDGTSHFLDRIRPVVKLLDVPDTGLNDAATDTAVLAGWLSEKIPHWPAEELLAAARESHDDFEMGLRVWRVLGDVAELPKWNDALQALGEGYRPVENDRAEDQARRHLEEAARTLRTFARHVATTAPDGADGRARLFAAIDSASERVEWDDAWSLRWWEVPFSAVLGELHARYEEIPGVRLQLGAFEEARTIDEFKSALEKQGVALNPDPLEVARGNQERLHVAFRSVWEIYEAWLAKEGADSPVRGAPAISMKPSMYLDTWPEAEVLACATRTINNKKFSDVVNVCTTLDEMSVKLDISPESLERTRKSRRRQDRTKAREKRTFNVGGKPYEIDGPETYTTLFRRLKGLPQPVGPRANLDEITRLESVHPHRSSDSSGHEGRIWLAKARAKPKTGQLYASPHLRELVGVVGEMHAFRFLQSKFNIDEHAWVSEFRTKVLPLRESETDETSDSLGYDFRFAYGGRWWCVEVKATTEDDTRFELASSQLAAANRIADSKDEQWRILRVRRALSEEPLCDWLPNPFDRGTAHGLRLRQGTVTVEYTPSRNWGNDD